MLGRVETYKAVGLLRIALPGIARQNRIREDRSAAFNDATGGMARDQLFWRLPLLYPIFQCGHCVKLTEPRASAAVMNPWNEKEAEEIFGLFAAAHEFHNALVGSRSKTLP